MAAATGRIRRGACGSVAWIALLGASTAAADGHGPRADSVAEQHRTDLYREGVSAAASGDWARARDRFRETVAIRSSAKVLFSLAQAEQHLGQSASARADYARAADEARAAGGEDDVIRTAEVAEREIEPRVPHLRIVVSGASQATALLDERPVAVGEVLAVDPGTHQVKAAAPRMLPSTVSVALGDGQMLEVPIHLEAEPIPLVATPESRLAPIEASPPPVLPASPPRPWKTVGIVAAGTGMVALAVGTGLAFVAKSKNDQSYTDGCTMSVCTSTQGFQARSDALSLATAATVTLVGGGVLSGSGVLLWLFAPSSKQRASTTLTPVAFAKGGALVATGSWP
jgi:hypothetical protein